MRVPEVSTRHPSAVKSKPGKLGKPFHSGPRDLEVLHRTLDILQPEKKMMPKQHKNPVPAETLANETYSENTEIPTPSNSGPHKASTSGKILPLLPPFPSLPPSLPPSPPLPPSLPPSLTRVRTVLGRLGAARSSWKPAQASRSGQQKTPRRARKKQQC